MLHNFSQGRRPSRVGLDFLNRGGLLYAGSYRDVNRVPITKHYPSPMLRVNMAEEILIASDVQVPVQDFGVPSKDQFMAALAKAAFHLIRGGPVYVGCGYGIGRTGTFLAGLFALHRDAQWVLRRGEGRSTDVSYDPVEETRAKYYEGAVETREQAEFVRSLDYLPLARRVALRVKPLVLLDKRYWID